MRINLFAGAGAGKTLTAVGVFRELNILGHEIEIVPEFIKKMAYKGILPKSFGQLSVFATQLEYEDEPLQSVAHIVTDSPVMMQIVYARKYGFPGCDEMISLAHKFEKQHPSINIFLDRGNIPYKEKGRYEKHEDAKVMDEVIEAFLNEQKIPYTVFHSRDLDGLVKFLDKRLSGEN